MVYKLGMAVKKELLLQIRDIGGLIILFVMPLLLLITITVVQKGSFDSLTGAKIPVLLVDNDQDSISYAIQKELGSIGNFTLVNQINGIPVIEEEAKQAVFKGDFQLAIVLPANMTSDLNRQVQQNVDRIMSEFSYAEEDTVAVENLPVAGKEIRLYFDPATQPSFKTAVKSSIDKLVATIETGRIYAKFQEQLSDEVDDAFEQKAFISFKEIGPEKEGEEIKPDAGQHNVPAWTLFAIFFIIVPLSINIVKEKSQGTMIRLITNPVPYYVFILGKTISYLFISLIQFYLMLAVGVYLFPLMGIPAFEIDNNFLKLSVLAIFSGLAAIGTGIAVGTIATTQEQSAPFGATFVVILAAIGGVWVPVFIMPKVMQVISKISPMNWALNGFYDVLLRNGSWIDIMPEIILLFLFFGLTIAIAIIYDKKKRTI
ncbi:ABC transporter permease [Sphingobacterium olei]|nr:ABC transporter permease [Sphingobacterium olei]